MAPKVVDRFKRKEEIAQAALRVFETTQISATTIEMIAKEAGLSKGSFYELFSNRDELVLYIFDSFSGQISQHFDEIHSALLSASEKLIKVFTFSIEMASQNNPISDIAFEFWRLAFVEKWPVAVEKMQAFLAHYFTFFETLIQEGIDKGDFIPHNPNHTARALGGMIDGLQLQVLIHPYDVMETSKHAVETFLKGITPKENL